MERKSDVYENPITTLSLIVSGVVLPVASQYVFRINPGAIFISLYPRLDHCRPSVNTLDIARGFVKCLLLQLFLRRVEKLRLGRFRREHSVKESC